MSVHHTNPLLVSWDPISLCFLVSDFSTSFKPIKTEVSLARFILEYSEMQPHLIRWRAGKLSFSARTSSLDSEQIDLWMRQHVIEPAAKIGQTKMLSLDDLL
jgi:hypothetical protein